MIQTAITVVTFLVLGMAAFIIYTVDHHKDENDV